VTAKACADAVALPNAAAIVSLAAAALALELVAALFDAARALELAGRVPARQATVTVRRWNLS
jgi:hypothetical protein